MLKQYLFSVLKQMKFLEDKKICSYIELKLNL